MKHKPPRTHTWKRPQRKASCLIGSFPDSSFSSQRGRTVFLTHLSQPLCTDRCRPQTCPNLNYPGMPHVSLCSYPCLPSWLQSLLSTQLKTNSSRPGETPGRTFVFIKWIWGEQVCFAGSGSLPLSPCLSVLPGSGWWSRERRLLACQRDPLAAWTQAPDIRWDRGSPPPSCWRQTQTDHKSARC